MGRPLAREDLRLPISAFLYFLIKLELSYCLPCGSDSHAEARHGQIRLFAGAEAARARIQILVELDGLLMVRADSAMLRSHRLLTTVVRCAAVHDVARSGTVVLATTLVEEGLRELMVLMVLLLVMVMLRALAVRRLLLSVGLVMLLVVLRELLPLLAVRGQELCDRCMHLAANCSSVYNSRTTVLTYELCAGWQSVGILAMNV